MNVVMPGAFQMVLGLYGFLLPMLLYVVWSTLALWDLSRRESLSAACLWGWAFVVFLLPFLGALAYMFGGKSTVTPRSRWLIVGGGAAAYLAVLLLGHSAGGIG